VRHVRTEVSPEQRPPKTPHMEDYGVRLGQYSKQHHLAITLPSSWHTPGLSGDCLFAFFVCPGREMGAFQISCDTDNLQRSFIVLLASSMFHCGPSY
jgi:hypothetical protein